MVWLVLLSTIYQISYELKNFIIWNLINEIKHRKGNTMALTKQTCIVSFDNLSFSPLDCRIHFSSQLSDRERESIVEH
ncbi:hypothetical protein RJT34_30095 [Clitoria ternatea]|uniref:Uncharacterized protein n=1 Tax=Clitoria ternatea TaxID=43366 RepID=A0AAN9ESG4_CLITE